MPADGLASLSYDEATNRVSTAGWEYDAAGSQTRIRGAGGAWRRAEYDAAGRMVKVKTDAGALIAAYTYGDSNQRLVADEGGVRTYFAAGGGTVLSEYVESGTSLSGGSSSSAWWVFSSFGFRPATGHDEAMYPPQGHPLYVIIELCRRGSTAAIRTTLRFNHVPCSVLM